MIWTPKLVEVPTIVSVPVGTPWKNEEDLKITVEASPSLKSGDFITTDTGHYMTATTNATRVSWEYEPRNKSGPLTFKPQEGKIPKITFSPPVDTVGQPPLSYNVIGKTTYASAADSFKQNALSRLRQEYVNMNKRRRPEANAFDTEAAAYQHTARWGLLNNRDVHSYHEHHILSFINEKARLLKQKYTGQFIFTAGYACPVENGHEPESEHIYGKALDYDAGTDSEATSIRNHAIYWVGKDSLKATFSLLYDRNKNYYQDIDPNHNTKPENFVGAWYKSGHMDWRPTAQP